MAHDLATITVSGNLLSNDFLHSSKSPHNKLPAFDPSTFNPDWTSESDLTRAINRAWENLKERFDRFDHARGEMVNLESSALRSQWLVPLLRDLGFEPVYQKAHTRLKGVKESFAISHRGWEGADAPALHLVGVQDDLDLKAGRGAKSPQQMLQNYLNQDAAQRWAILSNGMVLRLLRDYFHTSQSGYVQFNLYEMVLAREYDEFVSLFRLAHASRFRARQVQPVPEPDEPEETGDESNDEPNDESADTSAEAPTPEPSSKQLPIWLERIYEHSRSEGSRAEAHLRENVKGALEILGQGLLTPSLVDKLQDSDALEQYYRQLLRVVYRSIFLLFAEQRGLVPTAAPYRELYHSEYSLTALRDMAEAERHTQDAASDLWERLLLTFELARVGNEGLGVQPFNGKLFARSSIHLLTGSVYDLADRNRRIEEGDSLPQLSNDDTLRFITCLGFTSALGAKERINYRDLKVEEIGHIYESLLDYTPRLSAEGNFYLDAGTDRKSTGSYYTPRELVQEVMVRTLEPVLISSFEAAGESYDAKEEAILSIRVLDPACGSAAFLIAATDMLAQELADLRWQQRHTQPTSSTSQNYADVQQDAKRDVLSHCIYGVDLNDMAVELAQVALWINAASAGHPLSFLDHRLKHGNSLVGAPLNFVQLGIDPDAYKGRGDADPEALKEVRKIFSKKQLEQHRANSQGQLFDLAIALPNLDTDENAAEDVAQKAALYAQFRAEERYKKWQFIADYWTSAFFYPVQPSAGHIPNQRGLNSLLQNFDAKNAADLLPAGADHRLKGNIEAQKHQHRFFHYFLEFPEVFFNEDGTLKEGGGFDVIVGNPPWERVKLQEKEFFSTRDAEIANAPNAAKRKKMIAALERDNPDLYNAFQNALISADASSNFLRTSGRYPLGGVGDVNTYQVFTENARDLTSKGGRTGIIVPTGVATDSFTQHLFRDFVENRSLVSLDDFENREKMFIAVDSRMKFCVLILAAKGSAPEAAHFSFFNTNISHLNDPARWFHLSFEDFKAINPNTLTCPTFRTGKDAEITLKMYERAGVFIDENDEKNGNPWGASFMTMFHMSNDSSLFRTKAELEAQGFTLLGNRFVLGNEVYLPLYEGKMAHIYDHHFAHFDDASDKYIPFLNRLPDSTIISQYYVPENLVIERARRRGWNRKWFFGFRRVTRSNDMRTVIGSFVPWGAVTYGLYLTFSPVNLLKFITLTANLNSLTFDFHARNALSQPSLTYGVINQLPDIKIHEYTPDHLAFIIPRVLELTYTAWDIKAFADDLWAEADGAMQERLREQWQANAGAAGAGHDFAPPAWAEDAHAGCPLAPFTWHEARRAELRAELDALYAHLYGLTRDELLWILDPRDVDPSTPSVTFPGLRRNEEKKYGEYRTKRLVLGFFDALAGQFAAAAEQV